MGLGVSADRYPPPIFGLSNDFKPDISSGFFKPADASRRAFFCPEQEAAETGFMPERFTGTGENLAGRFSVFSRLCGGREGGFFNFRLFF